MFRLAVLALILTFPAASAPVVDQANGVFTQQFTDAAGISSKTAADVNVASAVLQLTNSTGGFLAPFNVVGQVTTAEVIPVSIARWGMVTVDAYTPAGTAVKVQVLDDSGTAFSDALLPGNVAGFTAASVDISALPVTRIQTNTGNTKPARIYLRITLSTSNAGLTPTVRSVGVWWTVKTGDLSPAPVASTAWATPRASNQSINRVIQGGARQYPAIAWAKNIGSSYGGPFLRGTGDTIYFKHQGNFGADGALMAVDRKTGTTIWSTQLSGNSFTNPNFTLSQNGTIYNSDIFTDLMLAFDASNGTLKWTHAFYSGHGNAEAAIGADGAIYTVRYDESPSNTLIVYAFAPDGSTKWRREIPDPIAGAGDISAGPISVAPDGTLYFVSTIWDRNWNQLNAGMLYSVDPANGTIKWAYASGDSYLAPIIDEGGTVYVANTGASSSAKRVTAVNPDGGLKWVYSMAASTGWSNVSLRPDGALLVERSTAEYPAYGGAVDAIEAASGTLVWSQQLNDDNMGDGAIHVFFGDSEGGFYRSATSYQQSSSLAYHDSTGKRRWSMSVAEATDVRFMFGMQDESGMLYADLYKNGSTSVFGVRPWFLTASTDLPSYQPSTSITFSAKTSMLRTNIITGMPNQVQLVLEDGTKIPMTLQSTSADGEAVWTAAYQLPRTISSGVHAYTIEANAAGIATDIPVHFNTPASGSNNTGLIASGSFLVESRKGGAGVQLASSQPTAYFRQAVTFTATATPGSASALVTFTDGGALLGSAPLDASGRAVLTTSFQVIGSHSITAAYSGYSSTAIQQEVIAAPTTTTLSASATTVALGQAVTFTAAVSSDLSGYGSPSGLVTFLDKGKTLASVALDATGHAVYTAPALSDGPHQITAAYEGSAMFAASASSTLMERVRK